MREWTLSEAREWLLDKCIKQRERGRRAPYFRFDFGQPLRPEVPYDRLVWEAFQILESEGIITGKPVRADNTGDLPIMLIKVALTPQAVLEIERQNATPDRAHGTKTAKIGFD